jgi:hypothetical protein
MEDIKKNILGALAGLFGWVVVSIPKVQAQKVTWAVMLSHIGVALLVGFSTLALLPHVGLGKVSTSLSVAIASVAGSVADQIILLFQTTLLALVRKFSKKVIAEKTADPPDQNGADGHINN